MNYGKMIVRFRLNIQDGLNFLSLPESERQHGGQKVCRAAGREVFQRDRDNLVCSCCGRPAEEWMAGHQSKRDRMLWLNLFGRDGDNAVLFTRDHIIPRAFGGVDDVANMRTMCALCNTARATSMSEADVEFLKNNTHLIHMPRYEAMVQRMLHPKFQNDREILGVLANIHSVADGFKAIIEQLGQEVALIYPTMIDDYAAICAKYDELQQRYKTAIGE